MRSSIRYALIVALAVVALPSVVRAQTPETVEYYGTDTIGSIRIVFDVNGTVLGRRDFTPFGTPVAPAPTMPKEGFGGNVKDDETDLSYFHARMLQARTGRFSRPDPISGDGSNPQQWNRYAYALDNPITITDQNGLWPVFPLLCAYIVCESTGVTAPLLPIGGGGVGDDGMLITDPDLGANHDGGGGPGVSGGDTKVDSPPEDPPVAETCKPVPFKVTGVAPHQAPGQTAITFTPRKDIPNGGVAIKPENFGVSMPLDATSRDVLSHIQLYADWGSVAKPNRRAPAVPTGLPSKGPYFPVDVIGDKKEREKPGNEIDVYNYTSFRNAFASTRTVNVTAVIPPNTVGATCPK